MPTRSASIELCGIEIEQVLAGLDVLGVLQSNCVELKLGPQDVDDLFAEQLQSNCVELK